MNTEPPAVRVCEHGQLSRVCPHCEAAAEIERLRAEVAAHRKHDVLRCDALMKAEAELASLRQKARLWDAVRSGKVRIDYNLDDTYGAFYGPIGKGKRTLTLDTAEEAVEAAIAAGALK